MKPIGGYFEFELRNGEHYHRNAICLNTARNCFEYVLLARHYRKVYIPYYTCEVMLEPVNKLGIDYQFYHINESLEPVEQPVLREGEAFLYTNYFGLKQECVKRLANFYGNQLIVDNAQAFYAEPLQGIDTFYSARKFFGVVDGAYLYTDRKIEHDFEQDVSFDRMSHLLKRVDLGAEAGYQDFKKNDDALIGQDIKWMSKLTEALLTGIDFECAKKKRIENFNTLTESLGATNQFHFTLREDDVPMVYPYFTDDATLKKRLITEKIFVATYWPNIFEWCNEDDLEYSFAQNICFLPIDQRYGIEEMDAIISIVK